MAVQQEWIGAVMMQDLQTPCPASAFMVPCMALAFMTIGTALTGTKQGGPLFICMEVNPSLAVLYSTYVCWKGCVRALTASLFHDSCRLRTALNFVLVRVTLIACHINSLHKCTHGHCAGTWVTSWIINFSVNFLSYHSTWSWKSLDHGGKERKEKEKYINSEALPTLINQLIPE